MKTVTALTALPTRTHRLHTHAGDVEWSDGHVMHREDGPAVERADGTREWWTEGYLHRDGAPAVITAAGDRLYFWRGRAHRADGPARIMANGDREWFRHGYRHRLDGPAVEHISGRREHWIDGRIAHTPRAVVLLREQFVTASVGHADCSPDHLCHGVPLPAPRPTRPVRPWRAAPGTHAA